LHVPFIENSTLITSEDYIIALNMLLTFKASNFIWVRDRMNYHLRFNCRGMVKCLRRKRRDRSKSQWGGRRMRVGGRRRMRQGWFD
jgi:hypothetical protein